MPDIGDLARAIQLALAPVFLLTGIGALLNVMTGRLARIVDRGRAFAEGKVSCVSCDRALITRELEALGPRRHLTSVAITATTIAALLVCAVIGGLFVEVMLQTPFKWLIGALFAAAMLALVVGLIVFLRELHLAMRAARMGMSAGAALPNRARPTSCRAFPDGLEDHERAPHGERRHGDVAPVTSRTGGIGRGIARTLASNGTEPC